MSDGGLAQTVAFKRRASRFDRWTVPLVALREAIINAMGVAKQQG